MFSYGLKCVQVLPWITIDFVFRFEMTLVLLADAMVAQANDLTSHYGDMGVSMEKILMQLPATWEVHWDH